MGIAIEIPSGILCSAIEIARIRPSLASIFDEINVVIPSGILWIIKAITEIIPSLYSELFVIIFSTFLSINIDIIIPSTINIDSIIVAGNNLNFQINRFNDSGINENKDIISITLAENDKEAAIIFSLLLFFSKHGINPSRVEKPAVEVIIKL